MEVYACTRVIGRACYHSHAQDTVIISGCGPRYLRSVCGLEAVGNCNAGAEMSTSRAGSGRGEWLSCGRWQQGPDTPPGKCWPRSARTIINGAPVTPRWRI